MLIDGPRYQFLKGSQLHAQTKKKTFSSCGKSRVVNCSQAMTVFIHTTTSIGRVMARSTGSGGLKPIMLDSKGDIFLGVNLVSRYAGKKRSLVERKFEKVNFFHRFEALEGTTYNK